LIFDCLPNFGGEKMVKKTKNNRELNRFNEENDLSPISSISPSFCNSLSKPHNLCDELIVALSEGYENRRARQVFEWEKSQKPTLRSAV
jgi:UDP-N-acetylglucosamine pyrophosphorylase